MKVLVTGAGGQLGSALAADFAARSEVVALDRRRLDLTDAPAVHARLVQARPEVIVNCAAYNHVDAAEDDAMTALQVNALAIRTLARVAAETGAVLVHYSTDFVFDGAADRPYTEQDSPNPQSVYACSKLMGEWFARDVERHYVLRVESLFGGLGHRGSLYKIFEALRDGRDAAVFVDRTVSPSYVPDVIQATRTLIETSAPFGLYHCVNEGAVTWFDIGQTIAKMLDVRARLVPVRLAETTLRARRPLFCALSNGRLASLGIRMPPWDDALTRYVAAVRSTRGPGTP